MKELVTTMTQCGQITIPAEVRRILGLKPRDKVAFTIEDGDVRLVPVNFTSASAFGLVEPLDGSDDFDEQVRQAKDERAAIVERAQPAELYSYDTDFDRVPGVNRIEPPAVATTPTR